MSMTATPADMTERIAEPIKDAEDGKLLAYAFPASAESVRTVLDAGADQEGRSPWLWLRLANGDLMLGVFPRGETYFAVEVDASDVTYPKQETA